MFSVYIELFMKKWKNKIKAQKWKNMSVDYSWDRFCFSSIHDLFLKTNLLSSVLGKNNKKYIL